MNKKQLLATLAPLTDAERMRHMVELGAQSRNDASLRRLINELAQGDTYERYLALQSCFGSRDTARVLNHLQDASRLVRGKAYTLVPLVCDGGDAQTALDRVNENGRYRMLKKFRRVGKQAVVDAYLSRLAGQSDPMLTELVALGSSELTARLLSAVMPTAGANEFKRFARWQPVLLADTLRAQSDRARQLEPRLVWLANAVLPILATHSAGSEQVAFALVTSLLRHVPLEQIALAPLLKTFPNPTADLLLASADRARVAFSEQLLPRVSEARLFNLIERGYLYIGNMGVLRWLRRLPAAGREAIFARYGRSWRDGQGQIPAYALALLTRTTRENEARRQWALPVLATRPLERLAYASLLPFAEAQTLLEPYTRSADAPTRAAALNALIGAVRFQPNSAATALTMVAARKNEQDPVRLSMLSALVALPPSRWQAEHLPAIGQIIRDALNAADLSPATAAYAEQWIALLLPFHPQWSAEWLAILVRERGSINLNVLRHRLTEADVHRIAPALMPVLESWLTREREGQLLNAARIFGKRLPAFPGLLDLLETLIGRTVNGYIAANALGLIAEHDQPRFQRLVVELLNADASWVTQAVVHNYLHRQRQDLLTPYLGQTAFRGRFTTGQTRYVLPFKGGFHRWTPQQQAIFAGVLAGVTADTMRDTPALINTTGQFAGLMMVEPTRLITLAGDSREAVRDAALRALGRLDAGQGIPTLLEAMSDDRARIAIYTLRGALLEMPADAALSLLQTMPLNRVTVAKEVLRLIGDLRTEAAFRHLLGVSAQELHPDVRMALLRALWNYPAYSETWALFQQSATVENASVASIVGRTPADRLSPDQQRELVAVLVTLLNHPNPAVRIDVLARCTQLPVFDPERQLIAPLIARAGSPLPDEANSAANALFATYGGRDATLMAETTRQLLPNRRTLVALLAALGRALQLSPAGLYPTAQAVLAVLETDPLTAARRVPLLLGAFPPDALVTQLRAWAEADVLHPDALTAVVNGMTPVRERLGYEEMVQIEAELRAQPDPRLRRVGLAALIAAATSAFGWQDDLLDRLADYQRDSSPWVAEAAQFVFPPTLA